MLCINLFLCLLLLSSTIGDNTIRSFMSTLPVAIYTDPLKQKGDIFKKNNKNLEFTHELLSHPVKLL